MLRDQVIDKYFINIKLHSDYADLFCVRKGILNAIINSLPAFRGALLDVGCGIMPYKELITENKSITSYTGLDFESSLEEEYHMGKPDLFWTGETIPLQDNSVDTVVATELFEHCANPEIVMKEIHRVLKPGGVLFFTVPFIWNLHLVPYDEYRYTPFSLKRHLHNASFNGIVLSPLGGMDASLAQMLGIWFRNRPLPGRIKNILWLLIRPIMQRLVSADRKTRENNLFSDGYMMTGLSGLAYKSA